jgi:hypothetical protein
MQIAISTFITLLRDGVVSVKWLSGTKQHILISMSMKPKYYISLKWLLLEKFL